MKNLITLLLVFYIATASAQSGSDCVGTTSTLPCCNGLIHTGPDAGRAINLERSAFTNQFDWRIDDYDVYHPLGYYTDGMGGPIQMPNPFKTTSSWLAAVNFYNVPIQQQGDYSILDYKPEDGWELLHRHLGYKPDDVTQVSTLENRKSPYIILYNRYTGVFRIFAALKDDYANTVKTSIELIKPTSSYKISGMLGFYDNDMQTLDENSNSLISRSSIYPGQNSWFMADFVMAYDPCVCNNEAKISINFETITTASVSMDGRLIATSTPLNGSGSSPLLNGADFLLALNQNNQNVVSGMQTYHNIDSLVAKFKSPPDLSSTEKKLYAKLGELLANGLSGAIDPLANGIVSTVATTLVNTIDPNLIRTFTGQDSLKIKLGLGGKAAEFLMSTVTPKKPAIPNISFIEGELKLTGTVTTTNFNTSFEIQLEHPGSKSSQYQSTTPNSDFTFYPTYNEALGVVSVLEKPEVFVFDDEGTYGHSKSSPEILRNHFELKTFKYLFNPAAKVDTVKTFLHAALVGKFKSTADRIGNFNRIKDADASDSNLYITDFYPIDCLHGIVDDSAYQDEINASISFTHAKIRSIAGGTQSFPPNHQFLIDFVEDSLNLYYPFMTAEDLMLPEGEFVQLDEFAEKTYNYFAHPIVRSHRFDNDLRLRVMFNYTFEENQYGKVVQNYQHMTFKTSKTNGNTSGGPYQYNLLGTEFDKYLVIDNSYVFTTNYLEVWERVIITGNYINWPSGYVTIIAPDIVVTDPALINHPNIRLINRSKPECACRYTHLGQVTQTQAKAFCLSSSYLASDPKFKTDPTVDNSSSTYYPSINFRLYPNPASTTTKLIFTTQSTDKTAGVTIKDISGREIYSRSIEIQNTQVNKHSIDVSGLANGFYFVTLKIGDSYKTEKLVLTR